jgi:hypothetical protein
MDGGRKIFRWIYGRTGLFLLVEGQALMKRSNPVSRDLV